jgi:hypothetical protein
MKGDLTMDWTKVVIAVIGLVFTGIVFPFVKSKLSQDAQKKLDYWLRYFIAAAEVQIDGVSLGQAKKNWVLERLRDIGLVTDRNEQDVSDLIDGICAELTATFVINRQNYFAELAVQQQLKEGDGE